MNVMKQTFLLLALIIGFALTGNAQHNPADFPTWTGRWTERQTETGAVEWLFQGKNNFAKIHYWGAAELGGKIHKGKFAVDTTNKLVTLTFENVIDIKENKVLSTGYHEEWKIISMANNELTLSRPILVSTDKPNKKGDNEHIYVTLKRTIKPRYEAVTAVNNH